MLFTIALLCISFIAKRALKWFLSCMNTNMHFHKVSCYHGFWANRTLVIAFSKSDWFIFDARYDLKYENKFVYLLFQIDCPEYFFFTKEHVLELIGVSKKLENTFQTSNMHSIHLLCRPAPRTSKNVFVIFNYVMML